MLRDENGNYEPGTIGYELQAFTFGSIQSAIQIKRMLDRKGISWEDFEQWVKEQIASGSRPPMPPMPEHIRNKLERTHISWDDFELWVDMVKEGRLPREILTRKPGKKPCPECERGVMTQSEVNTTRCNQVGGEWKSIWNCGFCGHDELDTESVLVESVTVQNPRKRPKRERSRIVDPRQVRMLYYGNPKRRVR